MNESESVAATGERSTVNGTSFDLAIVGAGSAGFSAAISAAEAGAKVALIGSGTIGGTCVNVGCVPSKTMIRAAQALQDAHLTARFSGLAGAARLTDWAQLIGAKDELVANLRQQKYADLLPEFEGISYLRGFARFQGTELYLDGAPLRANKIIITTGAAPAIPDIDGIADVPVLNSTSALELAELPQSMLIIGGGFIGCEFAQMFARMGTQVTLVTRGRLLPAAEPEVSAALTIYLREEGIAVLTGLSYHHLARTAGGASLMVTVDGRPERLAAERVMVTTGRTPNTSGLGLAEAGVAVNEKGAIVVDERLRTTRPGIYAAGDVTDRDQFVYMAAYGAKLAARNALNGDTSAYDNSAMPWVVFTDPQIAGVGLTEAGAQAAGYTVKTSLVPLNQVPRALAARDTRGLIKLVADARNNRLLGGQICAPEGADSIQTLVIALQQRMTTQALGELIFPYLTTVEALKLAAQAFDKDLTKLSCCAG